MLDFSSLLSSLTGNTGQDLGEMQQMLQQSTQQLQAQLLNLDLNDLPSGQDLQSLFGEIDTFDLGTGNYMIT